MKHIIKIILHIILSAAGLIIAAKYVTGIEVETWQAAIVVTFALFILRYTVKPILSIITLPINLLTLGLFSFVVNGLLFFIVGKYIEGFTVTTIFAGIIGAFVVSVIKTVGGWIIDTLL